LALSSNTQRFQHLLMRLQAVYPIQQDKKQFQESFLCHPVFYNDCNKTAVWGKCFFHENAIATYVNNRIITVTVRIWNGVSNSTCTHKMSSLLFRGFLPVVVNFLRRVPVVGNILNMPGISSVSKVICNFQLTSRKWGHLIFISNTTWT
jgi:hypothetical protein